MVVGIYRNVDIVKIELAVKNYILILVFGLSLMCGCDSSKRRLGYENVDIPDNVESVIERVSIVNGQLRVEYDTIYISDEIELFKQPLLTETHSDARFCIKYPSSWEIVKEDAMASSSTDIAILIMQRARDDYDFRPNINVIFSKENRIEDTAYLARLTYNQIKDYGIKTTLIGIRDCMIDLCNGSVVEYLMTVSDYRIHTYQYIVKKNDDTTITITVALSQKDLNRQEIIADAIINSIKIY